MLAILVVVTVFMPVVRFLGFDSEGAAYASYRSGYAYGAAAKQNRHVSVNCWREAKRRTWQADASRIRAFQLGCDDSQPGVPVDRFDYKRRVNTYVLYPD